MQCKLLYQVSLSATGQTSLLVLLDKQILSDMQDNLIVLNHKLDKVGRVPFPFKDSGVLASYIGPDQRSVILDIHYHNCLIYFDVSSQKMTKIRGRELKDVYLCSNYLWTDTECIIVAQHRKAYEPCLLVVDTQAFTVKLLPMSECEKVSPLLFNFLDKTNQYQSVIKASLQKKFIVLADYYDEQTLTFINTDTDKSRVISIKRELDEGKIGEDGYYWAESTPHDIHYQDEWILLVWEGRVVIISPNNKRKTINEIDTFMFFRARILSISEKSIKFVVMLHDMRSTLPTLIQVYEVSEE